jgi:hypothetical protein
LAAFSFSIELGAKKIAKVQTLLGRIYNGVYAGGDIKPGAAVKLVSQ